MAQVRLPPLTFHFSLLTNPPPASLAALPMKLPLALATLLLTATAAFAQIGQLDAEVSGFGQLWSSGMNDPQLGSARLRLYPNGGFALGFSGESTANFTGAWSSVRPGSVSLSVTSGLGRAGALGSGTIYFNRASAPTYIQITGLSRARPFQLTFSPNVRPLPTLQRPLPHAQPELGLREMDVAQGGEGALRFAGGRGEPLQSVTARLGDAGKATVILNASSGTYVLRGTWEHSGRNTVALTLRPPHATGRDIATGTMTLSYRHNSFRELDLSGAMNGANFSATFSSY